jgi:hypothetical protein
VSLKYLADEVRRPPTQITPPYGSSIRAPFQEAIGKEGPMRQAVAPLSRISTVASFKNHTKIRTEMGPDLVISGIRKHVTIQNGIKDAWIHGRRRLFPVMDKLLMGWGAKRNICPKIPKRY